MSNLSMFYPAGLDEINSNKNYIINGGFDVWQRGTSQTTAGYGSDDRWSNAGSNQTKTHQRMTFVVGSPEIPGSPTYFSRTTVGSVVSAATSTCRKQHSIEGVSTLAGETATLSFYARSTEGKPFSIELLQYYSSSALTTTFIEKITPVGIDWEKHVVTIDVPALDTTAQDSGNYLGINFWFSAGTNLDSRTGSLGAQSITIDLSQVKLEKGSIATDYIAKTYDEELRDCLRYYWSVIPLASNLWSGAVTTYSEGVTLTFPNTMRVSPSGGYTGYTESNCTFSDVVTTKHCVKVRVTTAGVAPYRIYNGTITLDAEL